MSQKWSKEEDFYLIENWKKKKLKDIASDLNRSPLGVKKRAGRLHLPPLRKWAEEETAYLIANWQKQDTNIIAKRFGKSVGALRKKAQKLHLQDGRVKWDEKQVLFLKSKWGLISPAKIAQHLNRDIRTVYAKAFELKLEGAREFASAMRRTGRFVPCTNCGTMHYRQKSRIKLLNFCSPSCRGAILKPSKDTIRKALLANKMKPNKSELLLDSLLQTHFPSEFAFNGDLSQGVMLGSLVPDFINVNGQKTIIELFGDYWHDKKKNIPWKSTEFGRQAVFSQLGYKLLVVWEHELKDQDALLEKIKEFNEK